MKTQILGMYGEFVTLAALTLALVLHAAPQAAGADDPEAVAPQTVGLSSDGLNAVTTYLQSFVNDGRIAGAVTLISRGGKIAHFEAVGYRDLESKTPMTKDSLFRIASMTKVAVAVAALTLMEEGKFALDDDAARYLPELRECRVRAPSPDGANTTNRATTVALQKPITIRDLLRHTSGLTRGPRMDALFREALVWDDRDGLKRVVDALIQTPMAFEPGSDFRYGLSSDVLGLLLERVTGQPLDQVLHQRVFETLRMADTGFFVEQEKAGRLTSYDAYENGRLVCKETATNSPFLKRPGSFSGGGGWPDGYSGLLTTATDWWRLCEMIRNRGELNGVRILRAETVDMMTTNQLGSIGSGFVPNRPGRGFGLSIGVVVDRDQMKDAGSNGQVFWAGGPYNTYFFIDVEQELVGILLLQTGPWRHLGLMERFNEMAHQAIEPSAGVADGKPHFLGEERGGRIEITPELQVMPLAEGVWLHTSWKVLPGGTRYPSNGLLVRDGDTLTLVDTAWGEQPTRDLLGWFGRELKLPVARAIVTHAHDDRMGGASVLAERCVPIFSHPLTGLMAVKQGWPHPESLATLSNTGSATNLGAVEVFYPARSLIRVTLHFLATL